MSRLGKTPINILKNVEVKVMPEKSISVKGPKGTIELGLKKGIMVEVKDSKVIVSISEKEKIPKADHGLYRALINNLIIGAGVGFKKELSLIGVGFRAAVKGKKLDLQVGFSHPTDIDIPEGIDVAVVKSVEITISGIDKQKVGHFAARVRSIKPPEPYKGKGIRYKDEYVRKKAGKSAKTK
ncbi:MAG: 50S ribosomal protein L6 [Candidatus Anoxychlamydiales bacterium]|nr:50S ribosomal protein L6 [Candidatus Anoxychlamydiales bacterium]